MFVCVCFALLFAQLLALVRAANPLLSFRELSVITGVPLRQVSVPRVSCLVPRVSF